MGSGLQKNQLVFESVIKIGWAEKKWLVKFDGVFFTLLKMFNEILIFKDFFTFFFTSQFSQWQGNFCTMNLKQL